MYEEIKNKDSGNSKEKVIFQEDVKLLNIIEGQEFVVKLNMDGYKYITVGKMNIFLTDYRNACGVYKRYRLK